MNNYAFIDSQNLYFGLKRLGWRMNYRRFRIYLREKYSAGTAFLFIGFVPGNEKLYRWLQEAGFILIFKPTIMSDDGMKGNCDAELVLHCMIEYQNFDKAVIVSGDGDFFCLIEHLQKNGKLERVIAPSPIDCSSLLHKVSGRRVGFIADLRPKLEYKKKNTPQGRNLVGDFSSLLMISV